MVREMIFIKLAVDRLLFTLKLITKHQKLHHLLLIRKNQDCLKELGLCLGKLIITEELFKFKRIDFGES